jgi:hypothetical protein
MMRLPADFWRELIAHKGYAATREPDAENYVTMSDDEVAMLLDFDGRRFWHQWRTKMRHPTAMPGIIQMTGSLVAATNRWVKAGFPKTPPDALEVRTVTCAGGVLAGKAVAPCQHFRPDALIRKCALCGCNDLKLTWATESCPAGKWGPVPPSGTEDAG